MLVSSRRHAAHLHMFRWGPHCSEAARLFHSPHPGWMSSSRAVWFPGSDRRQCSQQQRPLYSVSCQHPPASSCPRSFSISVREPATMQETAATRKTAAGSPAEAPGHQLARSQQTQHLVYMLMHAHLRPNVSSEFALMVSAHQQAANVSLWLHLPVAEGVRTAGRDCRFASS
jgi:hypothetical protein